MSKKKKIIIISAVAAVIVIAAILLVIFMGKNKYITISFDSNGAKKIEAQKIKKGETIKLPTVTKEGYKFTGWYNGNEKVSKYTKYDKDTTLKAKWIGEDVKTFTIKFDSDGGSKVDDLIIECGKELALPSQPTKEGYKFVSWIDKNDTPILDKALLSCEDIELKAKWEKEETTSTKKQESKTTSTTKKTEKQKSYKCPEGYTLSGTTCETKVHVTESCPAGLSKSESRGLCYISIPVVKRCNIGHQINGYCYSIDNNSLSNDPQACTASGYYYVNGTCYQARKDLDSVCQTGYAARPAGWADPSQTSEACIHTEVTIDTCPEGYSRDGSWCYKTINATLE